MARNWDNWNRYLDYDSKPLRGCVMFNVKDGNTVAPIYDGDETPLDNPILTDEYGRTEHQVFVDTDVVAYFYKYIGTGTYNSYRSQDIDINDDSLWDLQYTAENINDVLAHITADTVVSVSGISALRDLDIDTVPEIGGYKVITLLGYNVPGDKEPVNYVWDPSMTENDDNGSIIQGTELTGRWVMVKPTEHCDCRHFGIFPNNTTNFIGDTARMEQWISYCNSARVKPYFSADGDYRYYRYNNLSFTIPKIDVAKGVVFIDTGTSNIWRTEIDGDPYFYNHSTNINAREVKTSWGAYMFISPKHIIVDDAATFYNTTLSNCTVDIEVPVTAACSFTNCDVNIKATLSGASTFTNSIIDSKNNITSGCTFYNCRLTEDMFYGSPTVTVDNYCIADFDDFQHKLGMWKSIKSQQGMVNYDWGGVLTTESPWNTAVESDRWLINYKSISSSAELVEGNNAHVYYFENCYGPLKLQGKAANTYVFKDCEIVLTFADGYNQGCSVRCVDSTLNVSQDRIRLANLNCQGAVLVGTGSFDTDNSFLYNTNQNVPVYSGYCAVKDSDINNVLQIYGTNSDTVIPVSGEGAASGTVYYVRRLISGILVNNFVNGQIEIGTEYGDPNYVVVDLVRNLTITDNMGLSSTPIKVDRNNANKYDNYNIYTYKDNTGTMAMESIKDVTINPIRGYVPGVMNSLGYAGESPNIVYCNTEVGDPTLDIKLFSIGTEHVSVDVRIEFLLAKDMLIGGTSMWTSNGANNRRNVNYAGISSQFHWQLFNSALGTGLFESTVTGYIKVVQV